jgi:hypothetical protein
VRSNELQIRHRKKEPQIETIFLSEYPPKTADGIWFEPIGLDEPYRIIVQNNPVNEIDPLGLEGLTSTDDHGNYDPSGDPFNNNYDPNKKECEKAPQDKCLKVFMDCMADTLGAPGWSNVTTSGAAAYADYSTASAWEHAASRNLPFPMKSSIVQRRLNIGGKASALGTLVTVITAEGICLLKEIACVNGK